ncbi:ATP synthase F0 subunit 8 (mitochondrion) [Ramazzottius varieornatus]|uniref:ATP synthase F0 subunit 8 n=1 Tax=Ramazzottius varieornatus TaxID=947166 RepID=A0A1C9ZP17_RAMVA|nr:ATP synthase F0 subunit 8 [Ramazzottius varieornatus]BAV58163.1 ATP synthase F0 subunit 8 [Ramazzottius varieornatus]
MPHMSNLPWMSIYITMFVMMNLIFMSYSSPLHNSTNKKLSTKLLSEKNKWLW